MSDPTLLGGARYWIVVSADLNDSIEWNLNIVNDPAAQAISADGGATWFSPSGNTPGAFEINAIIPEPGSAGLLLVAGLLFGGICKVKRRWFSVSQGESAKVCASGSG